MGALLPQVVELGEKNGKNSNFITQIAQIAQIFIKKTKPIDNVYKLAERQSRLHNFLNKIFTLEKKYIHFLLT